MADKPNIKKVVIVALVFAIIWGAIGGAIIGVLYNSYYRQLASIQNKYNQLSYQLNVTESKEKNYALIVNFLFQHMNLSYSPL